MPKNTDPKRINLHVRPADVAVYGLLRTSGVNVSQLLAAAMRAEGARTLGSVSPKELQPAVARLREQLSEQRTADSREGFGAGKEWVRAEASVNELLTLERRAPDAGLSDLDFFQQVQTTGLLELFERAACKQEAQSQHMAPPLDHNCAYVRGWVDGALRSWASIKKEVLSG